MTASVTRKYRFSASHRLHTSALTREENARVFGKCNNPYGHGHDYELEVTVRGKVDPESGVVVPVAELDRFVETKVLNRFANKNINLDVVEFAHLVPTTENVAIVVGRQLADGWCDAGLGNAQLTRIHIQETGRNGFELFVNEPSLKTASL